MKNKKKMIGVIVLTLAAVMVVMCVAGCIAEKSVTVTFHNLKDSEIVAAPNQLKNLSKVFNVMTMTVSRAGEYPVVLKDGDGTQYTFTIIYEKGEVNVEADHFLEYTVVIK